MMTIALGEKGKAMSRSIDAEALIKLHESKEGFPWFECVRFNRLAKRIDEAPHIDIVRCKECKWAKANGTYQWCGRLDSTARITADDYCSHGERKESE